MKIIHLAYVVSDLEKSAAFYEDVLGFTRVGPRTPGSYPGMGYDLTDGELHLSLLQPNDTVERVAWSHGVDGPNHFGAVVDDMDEVERKLATYGIKAYAHQYKGGDKANGATYFKFQDLDGAEVDVSAKPWEISYA